MRPTPPPQRLPEIDSDVLYAFRVAEDLAQKEFRRWLSRQNKLTQVPIQTPSVSSSDMLNSVISSPLGDTGISDEIISLGLGPNSVYRPEQRLRSPLTPTPSAGSPKRPADSLRSRSASPRYKARSKGAIVTAVFGRRGRNLKSRPDSRSPTQMTPTPPPRSPR